jgi:hypothetical protein
MVVFILPKMKDSELSTPDRAGVWKADNKTKFESVAKSLDYQAPGENKKINSVPDMWALPMTLDIPLLNNVHPLRKQAIAQWQGMLAAIALAKVRNFPLKADFLDLSKVDRSDIFAKSLWQLLPDKTLSLQDLGEDKHPWQDIYVWKWNDKPVGMTSPSTIVVPSAEGVWDGLPWWNAEYKRLEFPQPYLSEDEKPLLREWLGLLQQEIVKYNPNREILENRSTLLNAFRSGLIGSTDRTDILELESPQYFGVPLNRGIYNGLNYPIKPKTIRGGESPLRVFGTKPNPKQLLLIDANLPEIWGQSPQNIAVHGDRTMATLDVAALRAGKIPNWDDIAWVEPQDIFLNELYFIGFEKAIPGGYVPKGNQPLVYNNSRITPLFPVNSILLEYFSAEDLYERMRFNQVDNSNTVRVTLNLPLAGMSGRPIEHQIVKEYTLDEKNIIDSIPVLDVWPHFNVAEWHEYYAFYYDGSRNNTSFQVSFNEARDPYIFEDKGKYQITRLHSFPTHINCLRNNQGIGLILLPTPPETKLDETGEWLVGVDFGTSFTNIYVNRYGKIEPLPLTNLHLKVTQADEERRTPVLFEYFIPEQFLPLDKPLPIASVLTLRGKQRNENLRPIYDGRIYIPDRVNFQPQSRWMETDIKWKNIDVNRVFLHHLATIVGALAAKDGVKKVKWSISYPSAFSRTDLRKYSKNWKDLTEELNKQTPIQHICPDQSDDEFFRTESLAIAQYFADREGANLVRAACVDLGGGTSDISIWQENNLLHQCSVQVAGRHLFSQIVEVRPELIVKWFRQDPAEWADLEDDKFKAKIDVLLRHESENWLKNDRHTVEEEKDFQGLVRLITLGTAGLYYYIGIILSALKEEDKYTEDEIPDVFIGGNGARLLHWITTGGKFDRNAEANELFKRMLARPSMLKEVDGDTRISTKPKDEAACGLVVGKTKLKGLGRKDKDPLIAGENCTLNGSNISARDRLPVDEGDITDFSIPHLDLLKQFVEDFNHAIYDLDIEEIEPMESYKRNSGFDEKYEERLWSQTTKELRRVLLTVKGHSDNIRVEPPFILGLKALLRVLANEWAGK